MTNLFASPTDGGPSDKERDRAQAIFANALLDKGMNAQAIALARQLLAKPDLDERAALWARDVLLRNVPKWHRSMLRDLARNDAYQAALRRAVRPDDLVFEIGAGTGLLAMMAVQAGADSVVACEMHPVVATLAAEIVAANGFADRIRVLNCHSRDVDRGRDLPRPADLLVSEIFAADLLGEGVLAVHRDAVPRLLRPGARVIPARAAIMVALGHDAGLDNRRLQNVSGFDVSLFNAALPAGGSDASDLSIRSNAVALFEFDLARPDLWPASTAVVEVQGAGGPANVILQWIRLTLDNSGQADAIYENRPGTGSSHHWRTRVQVLHRGPVAADGVPARIGGYWADNKVEFWLE